MKTIKIDQNSDCWGEIDALKALLRESKHYATKSYTNAEIVSVAVNELYDKLVAEKKED